MICYATLQELPGIKRKYIPLVRDIIGAAQNKVKLSKPQDLEGY